MLSAFVLGMVAAATPGPIIMAVFGEVLQTGIGAGLRIMFVSMATEIAIALAVIGFVTIAGFPLAVYHAISIVGAGVLAWFAWMLWRRRDADAAGMHLGPRHVVLLMVTNGILWTFWVTVCVPLAMALREHVAFGQYLFLAGFELGYLVMALALVSVFSYCRIILDRPSIARGIFRVVGLVFVFYACRMGYDGISYFF
jgi:threonine/homoserine/homoserine lactone efflux protein